MIEDVSWSTIYFHRRSAREHFTTGIRSLFAIWNRPKNKFARRFLPALSLTLMKQDFVPRVNCTGCTLPAQRGWFDSHNQTKIDVEKIVKIFTIFYVSHTEQLTYYGLHAKRGKEAMDDLGLLENYKGCAVHDHWKIYFQFSCDHSLCNTHHLRELIYLTEQDQQAWAEELFKLLLEAKELVEATSENCLAKDSAELASITLRYDALLSEGFAQDIPPPTKTGKKKRGRPKQSKSKNMLDRLRDFKTEVLAFLTHPLIPFDNNQGERDVRMAKLKQKISGCFRGAEGGKIFARIRGYVSTLRKNELNILEGIRSTFTSTPILPTCALLAE